MKTSEEKFLDLLQYVLAPLFVFVFVIPYISFGQDANIENTEESSSIIETIISPVVVSESSEDTSEQDDVLDSDVIEIVDVDSSEDIPDSNELEDPVDGNELDSENDDEVIIEDSEDNLVSTEETGQDVENVEIVSEEDDLEQTDSEENDSNILESGEEIETEEFSEQDAVDEVEASDDETDEELINSDIDSNNEASDIVLEDKAVNAASLIGNIISDLIDSVKEKIASSQEEENIVEEDPISDSEEDNEGPIEECIDENTCFGPVDDFTEDENNDEIDLNIITKASVMLKTRKFVKEINIDKEALHSCHASDFFVDVSSQEESVTYIKLNKSVDLAYELELGSLPKGIDIKFIDSDDYLFVPGSSIDETKLIISKQEGAQKGNFSIPIFYTLKSIEDSSVICQLNIINL